MTNQKLHELIADGKFDLAQERVKYLLSYDPVSGFFVWVNPPQMAKSINSGDLAGTVNKHGYVRIFIDQKSYAAHRLAWLYLYGRFPKNQLDHINNIRKDNRICNLREATNSQNQLNRMSRKGSIYRGVYGPNKQGRYESRISIDGKSIQIGTFSSEIDAAIAFDQYAIETKNKFIKKNLDIGLISREDVSKKVIPSRVKKSKYRGVGFIEKSGKWNASITVNKKTIHIGNFKTDIEAAIAFDEWIDANKDCKSKTNKSLGLID